MTLTRACWLRSLFAGLAIVALPTGGSNLWAQGFGPDPFRPYNNQYDPYTYPTGPASPEAGQSGAAFRAGNRGANQYQNFLDELQGAGRQGTERYGIGVPYFRSAVDSSVVDRDGKRDYRPNRRVDRSLEKTQEVVAQKYLAYFTEKDPKKRAAFLRDYNQMRGKIARAMSARREDPTRMLEAAARIGSEPRRSAAADGSSAPSDSSARPPGLDSTGRSRTAGSARRETDRSIPPPPPLFPGTRSRSTTNRRSPTETLDRSRRLDSLDDVAPRRGASSGAASSAARRARESDPSSD